MNTSSPAETQPVSPAPRPSRRWLRWILIPLVLLLASWAALGLIAPKLLQQAAADWARKHGRQLSIAEVKILPWSMELTLNDVALREGDGRPLFQARRLYLNADLYALLLGRWQASEFSLDSPQMWLARDAKGQWNWEKLAADLSGPPKLESGSTPEKLPRLKLAALNLRNGQIRVIDRADGLRERFHLAPINLSLADLSTLEENGRYALHAELEGGGRFDWRGSMRLQPMQSMGEAKISDLPLASVWDYVHPHFAVNRPEGEISVQARYQFEMNGAAPDLTISSLNAELDKLKLRSPDGGSELELPQLKVEDGALDLSRSLLTVGRIEFNNGKLSARRDAQGRLDWLRALPAPQAAPPAPAKPSPWIVKLDSIRFNGWHADWRDDSFIRPLRVEANLPHLQLKLNQTPEQGAQLRDIGLTLNDIAVSSGGAQPWAKLARAELAPSLLDLKLREFKPGELILGGLDLSLVRQRNGQLELAQLLAQRPGAAPKASAKPAAPAWNWGYPATQLLNGGLHWRDQSMSKPLALDVSGLDAKLEPSASGKMALNLSARAGAGQLAAKLDIDPAAPAAQGGIQLKTLPVAPLAPYALSGTPLKLTGGALSADLKLNAASAKQWQLAGQVQVAKMSLQEPGEPLPLLGWNALSLSQLQVQGMPLKVSINDVKLEQPRARLILDPQRHLNWQQIFAGNSAPAKPASGKPAALPQVDVHSIHVQNGAVEFADHGMTPDFATRMHHLRGSIQNLSTRGGNRGRITLDGAVDQYGEVKVRGALSPLSPTDSTDIHLDFHNLALNNLNPYSMNFAGWQVKDGKLSLELRYLLDHRQLKGENRIVIDSIQLGDELKGDKGPHLPLRLAIALLEDSNGRIDLDLPVAGSLDDPQFSYGQVIWKAIVNVVTKVATAPFRALGALLGGEGFDDIRFVAGEAHVSPPEREKLDKVAALMAKRPKMQIAIAGGYAPDADSKQLARARVDSAVLAAAGHPPLDDEPLPTLDLKDPQTQSAIKTVYGRLIGRIKLLGHVLKPGGPSGEALAKQLRDEMLADQQVSQADLQKLAQQRAANARKTMLRHQPTLAERVTLDAPQKTSANRDGVELAVKITAK
ncbi:DUF748 domain-containing protein [Chromobacterium sp. IIBBL 290-4]|uniref:DUF748 domain-containing protein n=1 Tax=Chromobacterium sp. IIBBL 290-4 TaxID=2953890 RepID=UPI0020B67ADE|nr:DUF748 domain-containing protein [Chromobacterium sp. IIBBL 290-4]UTH74651.1 DUF748 domain-containing protein [Chromobacterium sp. IIBBL 290-4]